MKSGPSWAVALLAALSASSLPVLASPVEVLNENAAATAELATSSSEVIAGHPVEKTDRMSITVRNEANETAYAYFIGGDPAAGRPGHLNAAGSWLYMDGPNSHLEKAPGIVIQPNQTGHITLPAGGFGGRVWVSQGKPLDFYGQSQPPFADGSAGSTSYNTSFGFLEIHARDQYVWADISYIDFAAVNLGYNLTNADGEGHHNPGLPAGSIQRICDRLNAVGWGEACIKRADGSVLGVLPPGHVLSLSQFLVPYIDYVWERLRETALIYTTSSGQDICRVQGERNGQLTCVSQSSGTERSYRKPTSTEVLGCYDENPGQPNAVTAMDPLCAEFNRGTLFQSQASGDLYLPRQANRSEFYTGPFPNEYCKAIQKELGDDGRVYMSPRDDQNGEAGLYALKSPGATLSIAIRG